MPRVLALVRRFPARALVVATVAMVVLWWWWPTLRGPQRTIDVLVVGTGDIAVARDATERRVRESGLVVETQTDLGDWCTAVAELPARVRTLSPGTVVIGIADRGTCHDDPVSGLLTALRGVGDADVVLVRQPGTADAALAGLASAGRPVVVDPARLVGTAAPSSQPCLWWDVECPSGSVLVRAADGTLTLAGAERVSRVVVAELR